MHSLRTRHPAQDLRPRQRGVFCTHARATDADRHALPAPVAGVERSDADPGEPLSDRGARARKPTIYDVAERVGMNASTVSRALNSPGRISAETEARIRAAADELGFRTNPFARALPTGKTGMYAIVLPDITNPVHFDLIRGAEQVARSNGYTLLLAESQSSAEREREAIATAQPSVDGLVVVSSRLDGDELRRLAAAAPIVAANRTVDGLPSAGPDISTGYTAAIQHLEDLGHRSIAYLSGPLDRVDRSRWNLLFDLAVARRMSIVEIAVSGATVGAGAEALTRILASGVTGVLAYNDLVAHGVLLAARAEGLRMPDRFSLAGFDDIFSAELAVPALTTIRAPLDRIGAVAMEMLVDDKRNRVPTLVTLPTTLVVRESTAPPRPKS